MGIQRKTQKVETVLHLFQNSNKALSAVSLVCQLKDEMNKTTVYRILERLENEGIIHAFTGINGLTWYTKHKACASQTNNITYSHFQCEDCGAVECLSVEIPVPEILIFKLKRLR